MSFKFFYLIFILYRVRAIPLKEDIFNKINVKQELIAKNDTKIMDSPKIPEVSENVPSKEIYDTQEASYKPSLMTDASITSEKIVITTNQIYYDMLNERYEKLVENPELFDAEPKDKYRSKNHPRWFKNISRNVFDYINPYEDSAILRPKHFDKKCEKKGLLWIFVGSLVANYEKR